MNANCAWCEAPRTGGPKCPKCGAIYAKAEALKAGAPPSSIHDEEEAPAPPSSIPDETKFDKREDLSSLPSPTLAGWQDDAVDLTLEFKLRIAVIPSALFLAVLFHHWSLGHYLQRTFLTMMVHEAGHAASAWLCGFFAIPSLWVTPISNNRGFMVVIIIGAANGFVLFQGVRRGNYILGAVGATLLLVQLWCTFVLSQHSARALFTFGGDGGAMVLGALLMATFFAGRETQIYKGSLRWGFVVIGAAAFVDTFATWLEARTNEDAIPFGENEGVGLSDPSVLADVYGWSSRAMTNRYVTLGLFCLLGLTIVWIWGIRQTRLQVLGERNNALRGPII